MACRSSNPWRLLVLIAIAPSARGQSALVQDEIGFAKNLARHRQFDLATEHLARIASGELSPADRSACLLARAFIEKAGGVHDATLPGRIAKTRLAIEHYSEFLAKLSADPSIADGARADAAICSRQLGTLLRELAEQGGEPERDREQAAAAYRSAEQQLDALHQARLKRLDAMPDADPPIAHEATDDDPQRSAKGAAKLDAFEPVYELALTYRDWSLLYPEGDPKAQALLKKSLEQTTAYTWEFGAETIRGYDINFIAGLVHLGLHQREAGLAMLESVVDADLGVPAVIENNLDLSPEVVAALTKRVEQAWLEIARSCNEHSRFGDTERLRARVDGYYQKFADRGACRTEVGEQLMLEIAVAQMNSGSSGGIALLEDVALRNPGNDIGQRADELLAEAIRNGAQGGASGTIPASAWIRAAQAAQARHEPLDAIDAYHHALDAADRIGDPGERASVTIDCWFEIGGCYARLDRQVEATIAYAHGLAECRSTKGVADERVSRIAVAWYHSLAARFKETHDEGDRQARDAALARLAHDYQVKNTAYLAAVAEFQQARSLPRDRKDERAKAFQEIAQKLGAITATDADHDRSRVLLARCYGEQGSSDPGEFATALALLDAFDEYASAHEPKADRQCQLNREFSRAESVYYRSEWLLGLARYEDVLRVLEPFEAQFSGQPDFIPEVNFRRLVAYLELGRLAAAEKHFAEVTRQIDAGAMKPWRDTASYYLAKGLLKAAAFGVDEGKRRALLTNGAERMADYCEATGYASATNLEVVCETWSTLMDWPRAEAACLKLIDVLRADRQQDEPRVWRARRRLAEFLVEQRKFVEAAPLFRELEARFDKDPTFLRAAARCHGGWIDIVDGDTIEVPGAGDYPRAITFWDTLLTRGFMPADEKTPPWFEAKLQSIYCRYRGKEADPAYLPQAERLLANFKTMVWDFLATDPTFVQNHLGGDDAKRRWDYLFERVR
ncbi:MAG: hypothetical protein EXS13_02460 [Planctomycetes bacterium]|nr:hypothetical protein [Planctomycetota bacterium]